MVEEIKELLQELIKSVYEVNLRTKHDLFLNFWGHVNIVQFSYYENGWSVEKKLTYLEEINLSENSAIEKLKIIIMQIKKLEA